MATSTRPQNLALAGVALIMVGGLALVVFIAYRGHSQEQLWNEQWVSKTKDSLRAGKQSYVYFYCTSGTDKMVSEFAGMPEIESLNFNLTDLTDAGVQEIARLPNLSQLTLYGGNPRVGNEGLQFLAGHKSIKNLALVNIEVTDEGLQTLASLPALTDLTLYRESHREVRLTDAAVERKVGKVGLKKLNISGGWMSGAALERLRKALPDCEITTTEEGL